MERRSIRHQSYDEMTAVPTKGNVSDGFLRGWPSFVIGVYNMYVYVNAYAYAHAWMQACICVCVCVREINQRNMKSGATYCTSGRRQCQLLTIGQLNVAVECFNVVRGGSSRLSRFGLQSRIKGSDKLSTVVVACCNSSCWPDAKLSLSHE